jgi:two-component system cell cycle sensor histidine kinase/response regulator CckA
MIMPGGISGMALSQQLREQKPDLKVLIMSGYSAELVRDDGAFPANTSFLGKPFTLAQFSDSIRQMLDATP